MIRIPALIAEKTLITMVLIVRHELGFFPLQTLSPPEMKKNMELQIPVPKNPVWKRVDVKKRPTLPLNAKKPQRI